MFSLRRPESVCEWTNSPVGEVPGDRQPPIRRQRSTTVVFFLSTGCEVDQPAALSQCSDELAGDGCFDWWIKISIKKPHFPQEGITQCYCNTAGVGCAWGQRSGDCSD